MNNNPLSYPKRRYGMDHDRYQWSMMQDRAPIQWPGDKPLALWINLNIQHFPLSGPKPNVSPPGALTMPYPDLRHYTLRDYGNRVGIFRLLSALEQTEASASVALNGSLPERYPELVARLADTPYEWLGHGWNMQCMHAGDIEAAIEAEWINNTLAALERHRQQPIRGWFSPGRSQTRNTPELLKAAGLEYHCDWVNDELPYRFQTALGDLTCLPSSLELDDVFLLTQNLHSEDSFAQQIADAADFLIAEGKQHGGRLLSLNFHPWLMGQPHRISTFRQILESLLIERGANIWNATPSDIISAAHI